MTQRLSASRLNDYLACPHSAALWLDGVRPPDQEDAGLELIRKKGFEHEGRVLARLEAEYGPAVSIPSQGGLEARAAATHEAMQAGTPLIYQGALFNERWLGFPDFLVRSSTEGEIVYDAEDAKLPGRAKAEHVVQLGVYRRLTADAVGKAGGMGKIHVGGEAPAEVFDLRQTEHITARYMAEFEGFAAQTDRQTRPLPNAACGRCPFSPRCDAEWRAADRPTYVAGLRGDQLIKLERAGVATLAALAELPAGEQVAGIGVETLPNLIAQARLQKRYRETGEHAVELLPAVPGRGFALLPKPAPGDLFFDMEGYPHDPGGLEYLFGLFSPLAEHAADNFRGLWAHDSAAEKLAFEALMDLFSDHLRRYPRAHIYHYAAYETVALKKLASRYATREAALDQMLREQRFVDLYRVAKQALRASTESYSLKALEKIYWGQRAGEVTNAGDSIVEYERWRETGDRAILEAIERYNEDDCVSTAKLRDWLESLRPTDGPVPDGGPGLGSRAAIEGVGEGATGGGSPEPDDRALAREAFERGRQDLAVRVRASNVGDAAVRDLVAELLWFHQRANKPQWWALFDRQTWSDEELMDDIEGLGGLRLVSQEHLPRPARSDVATYRFPPQDTKLREGQSCKIAATLEPAGVIEAIDAAAGVLQLKRSVKWGDYPETCGLSPEGPLDQRGLIGAVVAFAERLANGDAASDRALLDVLQRNPPRLRGRHPGGPIVEADEDLVAGAIRAVRDLDESSLVIQGPPGTGKTYTASHAIFALLQDGLRVGVASNSHKAINNLLTAIEARATEARGHFDGVKKASHSDAGSEFAGQGFVTNVFSSDDVNPHHRLVGGTAFHFCQADADEYDYLFVDEAGQVSIANLVAMAGSAKNLVLIGDQMQLPQPVQGVHPGDTGLSCLDYLLKDHATVPPGMGILLDVSWRMHPDVCGLISEAIYEGRLRPHSRTVQRWIEDDAGLPRSGVHHLAIRHEGCRQGSPAEVDAVAGLVQQLLGARLRDLDGSKRPLTLADILVVAPYNLQVGLLRERLPEDLRVGTVDKFQGQEAPVVIISMATSRGADAPRGTEFLFNRNRLNVAISRAKCLAILVSSPQLLDVGSASVEDLVRLDLLARVQDREGERSASTAGQD